VKKILVENLSAESTQAVLRAAFAAFGQVHTATVVRDPETGRSRGIGLVEMNSEAAEAAIRGLDGKQLDGHTVRVREAEVQRRFLGAVGGRW
jgi:RNA recognition motif-containing protein